MKIGDVVMHAKRGTLFRLTQCSERRGIISNEIIVVLETLDGSGILVKSVTSFATQFQRYVGVGYAAQENKSGQAGAADGKDHCEHDRNITSTVDHQNPDTTRRMGLDRTPWHYAAGKRGRPRVKGTPPPGSRLNFAESRAILVGSGAGAVAPFSDAAASAADSDVTVLPEVQPATCGCSPRELDEPAA